MTPKGKAKKLANEFVTKSIFDMTDDELKTERVNSKAAALICVDQIIDEYNNEVIDSNDVNREQFWLDVKDELNSIK
jgi:hypothetical protein